MDDVELKPWPSAAAEGTFPSAAAEGVGVDTCIVDIPGPLSGAQDAASKDHTEEEGETANGVGRLVMKAFAGSAAGALILGQIVSADLAGVGMSVASLHDKGVNLPATLNLLTYVMLLLVYGCYIKKPSELHMQWWKYAAYAFVDVQSNYLTLLAFKYTSIASTMMLDSFSIPSSILLSRVFLGARYTREHMFGVLLCMLGLGVMIGSDVEREEQEGPDERYPKALLGDCLSIFAAFLYACMNVSQEYITKQYSRCELLGMLGLCGTAWSVLQILALETEDLAATNLSPAAVGLSFGYSCGMLFMYSAGALFLSLADAAMLNMSLLTSDVYSLVFAVEVEHLALNHLYFLAFAVIVCGLGYYHKQPAPLTASDVADLAAVERAQEKVDKAGLEKKAHTHTTTALQQFGGSEAGGSVQRAYI